jgi:hypothetical protein
MVHRKSNVCWQVFAWLALVLLFPALAACQANSSVMQDRQPLPTINPAFQTMMSPVATVAPYRCGSWTSDNAPGPGETITIYARLMHDLQGIPDKPASATVHFQYGDFTLTQEATSDSGGYVSFALPLAGRQPARVPATVDVTFNGLPGGPLRCTQAFFTPR